MLSSETDSGFNAVVSDLDFDANGLLLAKSGPGNRAQSSSLSDPKGTSENPDFDRLS